MTDSQRTELWQDLDRRVFLITQLINTSKQRLKDTERQLLENVPAVVPACYTAVNEVQRIIQSLEERMNQINQLIAAGKESDIAKATVIAGSDLTFKNDAMHKLISDESLAPIPFDDIGSHLDGLFRTAGQRKRRESSGLF